MSIDFRKNGKESVFVGDSILVFSLKGISRSEIEEHLDAVYGDCLLMATVKNWLNEFQRSQVGF